MRTPAVLAVLALATFALAGCSSSNPGNSTTGATGGSMSGHMMMAKTVEVAMKGNKFVNETVTIHKGDTVKWTNQDMVGHTVTADAGQTESFDSNPNCPAPLPAAPACIAPGGTYSFTFTKVGTTKYHCRVHSGMTGTIVVVDPMMMSGSMSGSMSMSHSSSSSSTSTTHSA